MCLRSLTCTSTLKVLKKKTYFKHIYRNIFKKLKVFTMFTIFRWLHFRKEVTTLSLHTTSQKQSSGRVKLDFTEVDRNNSSKTATSHFTGHHPRKKTKQNRQTINHNGPFWPPCD